MKEIFLPVFRDFGFLDFGFWILDFQKVQPTVQPLDVVAEKLFPQASYSLFNISINLIWATVHRFHQLKFYNFVFNRLQNTYYAIHEKMAVYNNVFIANYELRYIEKQKIRSYSSTTIHNKNPFRLEFFLSYGLYFSSYNYVAIHNTGF